MYVFKFVYIYMGFKNAWKRLVKAKNVKEAKKGRNKNKTHPSHCCNVSSFLKETPFEVLQYYHVIFLKRAQ